MTRRSLFPEALATARKVGLRLSVDMTWDDVRARIDIRTGGDLDAWQLDRATDEAIKMRDAAIKSAVQN